MEMIETKFGKITAEQDAIRQQVMKIAEEQGVDPALAEAIAWSESRFGKNIGPSRTGALGVMQVDPKNAKPLGMTVDQLKTPESNIRAGVTLLKNSIDRFGGNEIFGVAGYNTRWQTGDKFAKSKNPADLPPDTIKYLNEIDKYRPLQAATAKPAAEQPPAEAPAEQPVEPAVQAEAAPEAPSEAPAEDNIDQRLEQAQSEQERRMGQMYGAGTGAALTAKRLAGAGVRSALGSAGEAFAQGAARGARVEPFAGPRGAPVGQVQPPQRPLPSGGLPEPAGGRGTFNYGKAFGLTDIEAGRAIDMTKQAGGAHDIATQRREALQKLQQTFPGERYIENPRYGGLMTPEQRPGLGPRAPYQGGAMSGEFRPSGAVGSGRPPAIPTTPRVRPLDMITDTVKTMIGPGSKTARVAGAALKYAAPPLAFAQAGAEAADFASEIRKAAAEGRAPNVGYLARRGIGGLGSVLSAFPVTAPIGIPMALGPMAYEYLTEDGGLPTK
jgi:hypothetical protein